VERGRRPRIIDENKTSANECQNASRRKMEAAMAERKSKNDPLSFSLTPEQQRAIETIARGRKVRFSGRLRGGKFNVDYIACNSPFLACNAPFTACNSPFTACNSPFTACNAPFAKKRK
jgi:hypothetical protein